MMQQKVINLINDGGGPHAIVSSIDPPDQQEDSAERRSRSGHGGQLTAAIRSR
jgi:hypothetical protein